MVTDDLHNDSHKRWIFTFFFLGLLVISFLMLREILSAVILGALISYFLYPWYKKLELYFQSKRLAQIILGVGSIIVVIILLAALLVPLASQSRLLYQKSGQYINQAALLLKDCTSAEAECIIPTSLRQYIQVPIFKEKAQDFLEKSFLVLFSSISSLISSFINLVVFLVIMIFSLFYFLEHGQDVKKVVLDTIPIKNSYKEKLFNRLQETIRAVVGGNITSALLQGFFGGLIFFLLGLPASMFFGFVIAVLAFIPIIGPTLIWIPAAVILIVKGSLVKGLILIIYCPLILGSIDTFLKPKLIGDRMKMSSFAIFLGVIGGLQFFGLLGLFFGPIIIALLSTTVQLYTDMQN